MIYITRSDISWYSQNANAYQKPLMLSKAFELTLVCPQGTTVPMEIAERCRVVNVTCGDIRTGWSVWKVARFLKGAWRAVFCYSKQQQTNWSNGWFSTVTRKIRKKDACERHQKRLVATGFDIPCLMLGWLAKKWCRARWIVFCWDPPALSWRDKSGVLARGVIMGVDGWFKWLVKDADRLVLNIHPGLLKEIGYVPKTGQLIQTVNGTGDLSCDKEKEPETIGIVANAVEEKGLRLVLEALARITTKIPKLKVMWFGDKPDVRWITQIPSGVEFVGWLPHKQVMERLQVCTIAIHAYLDVPSLRWNFPLKVLEYMALGTTIVAADLPGVRELIQDGVNGMLFKPGDVNDLCRVLETVIGNQELCNRLSVQARRNVEKYRWSTLNRAVCDEL